MLVLSCHRSGNWKPETGNLSRAIPRSGPLPDDIVNNTVFLALFGTHDVVPLSIVLYSLQGLAGVVRQDLVQPFTRSEQLARMDVDVRCLAAQSLDPGLMNQ